MNRHDERESRKTETIKVSDAGPPCPRCAHPTEVLAHAEITEQMLRQPFYYRQWLVCTNPDCPTKDIKRNEDKVFSMDKGPYSGAATHGRERATIAKLDEDEVVAALAALADEIDRLRREQRRLRVGSRVVVKATQAETAGALAGVTRLIEDPVAGALHNALIMMGAHIVRTERNVDLRRLIEMVANYGANDGDLSEDEREYNEHMRRGLLTYRWERMMSDEPVK
jgi:hypothetical protein